MDAIFPVNCRGMPLLLTKTLLCIFAFFVFGCSSSPDKKAVSWKEKAAQVTIIRDDWDIPHIYGKTDADAVFGLMYAQCEESFERVERAYIEKLGRLSEVEGKAYLLQDLKTRLLYDTAAAIADYHRSPPWLKALCQAFADGIQYYLYRHPATKPLLLTKFEPWYPLLFTDGAYIATQTGGLQVSDIKALFGRELTALAEDFPDSRIPVGSNAFALAPSRTADGTTLLYINPHVSFYFRTEMHVVSEEGLNAYGAVTWGQFFVFQGFNEHCGWMHTASAVDASDLYAETIVSKDGRLYYEYDGGLKPLQHKRLRLLYKEGGTTGERQIETYQTHHGPVVGMRNGKWLSLRANNRSLEGLIQSWQRMKATDLASFTKLLQLRSNPSTNTMYADDKGNIAYWHGNFVPKREASLEPSLPLDGSTAKTEWQGVHEVDELVHSFNPKEGFLQNCNSSPFSVSGSGAIRKESYPPYMAPEGENFRSLHAIQLLALQKRATPDSLIRVGYSSYLAAFDTLLPPLFNDYKTMNKTAIPEPALKEAMDSLQRWDKNASASSVATTIAVFWAWTVLSRQSEKPENEAGQDQVKQVANAVQHTSSGERLQALASVLAELQKIYGTWKLPWGELNRFQRLSGSEQPAFDESKESLPVGLGPSFLGSLASFETVWHGSKQYGVAGNSFVAAVSFGAKLKAKSISTGGQSFVPGSRHFTDQAERFVKGELKDVYFYKDDVRQHAEKTYHPGEE